LLLKKCQERARTDLSAVIRNEETCSGNLVIFKQKHSGQFRLFERKRLHAFLDRQLPRSRNKQILKIPSVSCREPNWPFLQDEVRADLGTNFFERNDDDVENYAPHSHDGYRSCPHSEQHG